MRNMHNQIELIGNTGQEVNLVTFDSGTKKASVPFATSTYYKNAKGEFINQTQWHNIIAWGRNAELLKKAVQKGDHLLIRGSINYRKYEDKKGGQRNVTEIIMDNFIRMTREKTTKDIQQIKSKQTEVVLPF